MKSGAEKLRETYAITPNASIYQKEFGFYSLNRWVSQGHIPANYNQVYLDQLFGFDGEGRYTLWHLGWCEAPFVPEFETMVTEDRGAYEVVQDTAGRKVLYFKGRRQGFMPEYLDHPVKDQKSWEEQCLWRLNADDPLRFAYLDQERAGLRSANSDNMMITQCVVGGYMYLRSLVGPLELMYMFYDAPELIHQMMENWLTLADKTIAKHQELTTIDELFLAEDICYNGGPLISIAMIDDFLTPYYQQLVMNIKRRQIDPARHLYVQVDTDGFAVPVIPAYQRIGLDVMSPFEVAAGCDVVRIGQEFPGLVMTGGLDKRVLSGTRDDINRMLDAIIPIMKARGGYIPTCDHGVPEEVPFENYMHYRHLLQEYGS